jgi:protein involved in polysaccharide export with SLBB domain
VRPVFSALTHPLLSFLLLFSLVCNSALGQTGQLEESGGPLRLRQPTQVTQPAQPSISDSRDIPKRSSDIEKTPKEIPDQESRTWNLREKQSAQLGEFERYVHKAAQSERPIRRLGADLMNQAESESTAADFSPFSPDDHVINVGDEILVSFWGSVDADLRLTVDRNGRINVPRVGVINVAGVKLGDLNSLVERQASRVFRNFQVATSLGKIRGIRVFMTGYIRRPGMLSISSASTILSALVSAGGPTAAGSFRNIELRRGAKVVSNLDLYDLILKGDRSADKILQAGDVIHVQPVGSQVGVLGSVNNPAVVEIRKGETVADALQMAGGFSAVADRTRLTLEALRARNATGSEMLALPAAEKTLLSHGDIVHVLSMVAVAAPSETQNKRVRVEGEVLRPGDYVLPANAKLSDALKLAGGLTSRAYVFGVDLSRESVRSIQIENYDRALRDLETELTRTGSTQKVFNSEQAAAQTANSNAASRLIERLRSVRPTGRIVLQLEPDATQLPELALEDGDRLVVPQRPTTVGVFGSVFNSGSYFLESNSRIRDMLKLAGGPTRGADTNSVFVVRMNGSVASARQSGSWFGFSSGLSDLPALPGDTIFVPEELNKSSFIQEAKEWTQILYQFGLGAAALKTIRN